ncbi:ATP-binding protein [Herbaspirillum sp. ST 5-3]|uniref:sensor histidine kinase n=1 Tax=Oxalobacteraceae TaxID=75682 RepID=UPI0010A4778A|nr:ATP-binding protein [Herbaspirillum sp. ST 5-3]
MFPVLRFGWHDSLVLILGYVALDWVSYIHPLYGLNITPWSPAAALGLAYVLRFGPRAAAALGVAILIADAWVRHLPAALALWVALSALLTCGYWAIAALLRRRLAGTSLFADLHGLIEWVIIIALGTLLNSVVFVSALSFTRLIPPEAWSSALLRYWVGDCVGIIVSMPIFWMLLDERGRAKLRAVCLTRRMAVYFLVMLLSLWVAFGIGAQANYKYFYVLFLPIVWMAAKDGLTGAVLGATMVQLGIIGSVQLLGFPAVTVLEIQTLTVVLALLGFFIGVVVDEKQRMSAELRQTLRLAAAGEMAGALAHEINQPLTALSAYGGACEKLLAQGDTGERLRDVIQRMVAESHRAAEVVRRLRDFFRTGATQLEHVPLAALLSAASEPFEKRAREQDVTLSIAEVPACTLLADRLQIEVVLRNLLSNAFDAVTAQPGDKRSIRITAWLENPRSVCICVEDSGSGVPAELAAHLFEAFHSSKASGLGLGLTISRAIAEAHGGNLLAEPADHGIFKLILPVEGKRERSDHAT